MKYTLTNITQEKLYEAEQAIMHNGGAVYKDNRFLIMGVEGRYVLNGTTLTIEITDKPWLASWTMIEGKLREFFK